MTFFNDAFWTAYFVPKVGDLIALNSKPYRFSKLVDWVKSYVPGKCSTVITLLHVVNWDEIGRSMKDRKFMKKFMVSSTNASVFRPSPQIMNST